jgi:predicted transcriptional regulator of viral defense system
MNATVAKRLKAAFKATTLLRSHELAGLGVSRVQVAEAMKVGLLERAGRGLYRPPGADITEHHTFAEVGQRIPKGILCLLSALNFHRLTTQNPHEVWVALGHKAWHPRLDRVKLRVMRFSGAALREGVETHAIEGVPVKVYNPAKTVVDCFKFRNKVGLDVALEALRETWRARRCTMDELTHYANICRVTKVMKPYLESLTA